MAMRSPNEMIEEARKIMLDGREPSTQEDWARIVNFLAVNIHHDLVYPAMKLMKRIYDIPLSDEHIVEIIDFQLERV